MTRGRLDQGDDFLLTAGMDDEVGHPGEAAIFDRVHLLLGMTVAVPQALACVGRDRVGGQELADLTHEVALETGLGDLRRIGRDVDVGRIDLDLEGRLGPGKQIGQLRTRKLVALARQHHGAVRTNDEGGIPKAPDVETLRLGITRWRRARNDALVLARGEVATGRHPLRRPRHRLLVVPIGP